jgi:hypothetical protein
MILKGEPQEMYVREQYHLNPPKQPILQEQRRKEREKNLVELIKVVFVIILIIVFYIGVQHSQFLIRRPYISSYLLLRTPLKELNLLIKKKENLISIRY